MRRAVSIGSVGVLVGMMSIMACQPGGAEIWIVERDIPQTRNLIPVLTRTTLLAAGPEESATCRVTWKLGEPGVRKGRFWPEFGERARMGLPVLVPEGFPAPEPRVVEAPAISVDGDEAVLRWDGIELGPNEGAAIHAATWLGPPDLFHTGEGLAFGDVLVGTEYAATVKETGEEADSVTLTCRITVKNAHSQPVEGLEFAFFVPRALLDNETGKEIPLLGGFSAKAEGFSDAAPLDLLISDGLGRGAWGPRFSSKRDRLEAGESVSFSVVVTGTILDGEALVVPLVSLVARIQARYWPSSEVEVVPPGEVHYSDYTHFNLVVADSRLFRLEGGEARAEASSQEVRRHLGTGLEDK
jgi:hypothetical protein